MRLWIRDVDPACSPNAAVASRRRCWMAPALAESTSPGCHSPSLRSTTALPANIGGRGAATSPAQASNLCSANLQVYESARGRQNATLLWTLLWLACPRGSEIRCQQVVQLARLWRNRACSPVLAIPTAPYSPSRTLSSPMAPETV